MIIHLNGWPGVGKHTIGRLVAETLRARFIHNHLLHDVALRCTGLLDPQRWPLYEAVRSAAYAVLASRPNDEVFVMTNALCVRAERERVAWAHVVDLAVARTVPLIPIVLEAEFDENARRVRGADRIGRKLTDPDQLRAMTQTDAIQKPRVPELLILDVTRLSAAWAAAAIVEHVRLLPRPLREARDAHRCFAASSDAG